MAKKLNITVNMVKDSINQIVFPANLNLLDDEFVKVYDLINQPTRSQYYFAKVPYEMKRPTESAFCNKVIQEVNNWNYRPNNEYLKIGPSRTTLCSISCLRPFYMDLIDVFENRKNLYQFCIQNKQAIRTITTMLCVDESKSHIWYDDKSTLMTILQVLSVCWTPSEVDVTESVHKLFNDLYYGNMSVTKLKSTFRNL